MAKNDKGSKRRKRLNNAVRFSGLGIQIAVMIGLGAWLGGLLDEKYPMEKKWFTLVFVLAFTALAIYYAIRELNKINSDS